MRPDYPKWTEVDSWSFSMSQPADPTVGAKRGKGTMATGTFSFSMKHSGPQVFKSVATGAHIQGPATFVAERAGVAQGSAIGQNPNKQYLNLIFQDFVLTGRDIGGEAGQKTENVSVSFTVVGLGYAQVKDGQIQPMTTKMYDQKSLLVTTK
jgi:type VI protein secretion system component Hcp